MPDRIDTHQHVIPPFYRTLLAERGLTSRGWLTPDWSVDAAVATMGAAGISTGILWPGHP